MDLFWVFTVMSENSLTSLGNFLCINLVFAVLLMVSIYFYIDVMLNI